MPVRTGGGVDITARVIAQKLFESWGQPVVVENRPGANGTIAVDLTAKAPPDGYTLTMISSSHSVNVTLQKHHPYDLTRDLVPITQATVQPYVLVVNPGVRAWSVQDVVAMAKTKPGTVTYGSSGIGGFSHLAGALFGSLAGIEFTHVPYKGGAPAKFSKPLGQIAVTSVEKPVLLPQCLVKSSDRVRTSTLTPLNASVIGIRRVASASVRPRTFPAP